MVGELLPAPVPAGVLERGGLKRWIVPRDAVPGALYADEIISPSADVHGAALHSRPLRLQLSVANDVGMKLAVKGFSCSSTQLHYAARRVKEYLSNYATVHVHLLKMLAVDVDIDHDRRDCAGNARRSNHDLSK